ncbi:MAG: bifunctional nuclease family protein [Anaerolineae bacterium]|nr:bifunctional nuclease family protein [Anaerolineae bacterium]
MIEVEVHSIRVSLMNQQRVVLLKEQHRNRFLAIWIGPAESDAITIELQGKRHSRPLTHDLLKNVIEELNGRIVHILVNDIRNDTYFARLVIEVNGEKIDMDARPSDAIALALRTKSPIFVSEAVMERSGIEPEDELDLDAEEAAHRDYDEDDFDDDYIEDDVPDAEESEDVSVDESQFSAFADFVNSLNLDELDDSEDQ